VRCAGEMPDPRLAPLVLSEDERHTLESWASAAVRRRSWPCGRGSCWPAREAAATWPWPRGWASIAARSAPGGRFLARRLDGLSDEPRPGVPRTITDAQVEEVVIRTLEEVPEGATHWSKRKLARRVGILPTSVHRIWRAFGLQP